MIDIVLGMIGFILMCISFYFGFIYANKIKIAKDNTRTEIKQMTDEKKRESEKIEHDINKVANYFFNSRRGNK